MSQEPVWKWQIQLEQKQEESCYWQRAVMSNATGVSATLANCKCTGYFFRHFNHNEERNFEDQNVPAVVHNLFLP